MSPMAMAKKLEQAERILHEVRDALTEPGPPEAGGLAPEVDPARRTIIYRGVTVPLTAGQCKLAELLLSRPGESFSLEAIDAACRPPTEGWASDGAIRKLIGRLRERLRAAGLGSLADCIYGGYRCYAWHLSTDVHECQRRCPAPQGTLSAESECES